MLGLAFVACGQKEEIAKPEVFELLAEVATLPATAGTVQVTISTDYTDFDVVMATAEPWVTLVETKASLPVVEKVLTFSYTANPAMTVRQEAAQIVSKGEVLGEVIFTQAAGLPCVFVAPEVETLSAAGGVLELKVSYDYPEVNVEVDSDWVSLVETKGITDAVEHTYSFAYAAADSREERTATVTFTAEDKTVGEVVLTQAAFSGDVLLKKVFARYSDADGKAWCNFIPGISNRTMASDGEYVYLQSSEGTAKIYAIEIASLLAGEETPNYRSLDVTGISGGTHAVSAMRCVPNENGGYVLVAANLAIDGSQNFNIYAYPNGTDNAPVLFHAYRYDGVANVSDWRRYGDRISVSGTWQNGTIWASSQSGTKVMAFGIKDGATDASLRKYCWFDGMPGALTEATAYPGKDEVLLTEASSAGIWVPNADGATHSGGFWPKWDKKVDLNSSMKGAFSFQFFTVGDKKFIAYVQLSDNTHCNLVVVEDKGDFETSLAGEKLWSLPLYEGAAASCKAGNTYGDCAVVDINGKPHIVAMMQGGGLSIFEIQ